MILFTSDEILKCLQSETRLFGVHLDFVSEMASFLVDWSHMLALGRRGRIACHVKLSCEGGRNAADYDAG